MVAIPARKDKDQDVKKPELIPDYNQYMGGDDLCDQMWNYAFSRKSKKMVEKTVF